MSRLESSTAPSSTPPSQPPRSDEASLATRQVCPFCGTVNDKGTEVCPRCTMQDTPLTRQNTRARMGPWFVRQNRNPAAPGMRWETLLSLVRRGQVTPQSIVRGPTTHQFWRFAAQVKGLSRELGICYSCAAPVERDAILCPQCNRLQEPPINPDVLLEPLPGTAATAAGSSLSGSTPASATMPASALAATVRKEIPYPEPAAAPQPAPPPADEPPAASPVQGASALDEEAFALSPPSARPASVPATSRAPQPPARRGEEILSARELAAAFQLDFSPAGPAAKGPRPSRRGRLASFIAAMLLLGLIGAAAMLYLRPDLRAKAFGWQRVPDSPTTPPGNNAMADPAMRDAASDRQASRTAATVQSRSTRPPPANADDPANVQKATPNDPADSPRARTAGGSGSSRLSIDTPLPYEQARSMWREAHDAEAREDFAAAVELYEQIRQLPRSVWPGGLEVNLELAKRRLKTATSSSMSP